MSRQLKYSVWLLTLAVVFAPLAWSAPKVAVMDFENKSQRGGWRVGRGAADVLTTEMVKGTELEIFEREQLETVLAEQDLGRSGRVDPSTAAEIGKIIGVDYVVTGAVTEYGQNEAGGGGGGVDVDRRGYYATVDVRVVDAETSQIAFADSGSGTESSTSVQVFGIGGGEDWNEKKATEAMRGAVDEVVGKLARAEWQPAESTAPSEPVLLADVSGDAVILNAGSDAGLESGQTLTVKRKGREVKDPATGEVLKVNYETLGKIRITEVAGSYAEGSIVEGSGFEVGDQAAL